MEFVQMYRGYTIAKSIGGVLPMYVARDVNGTQITLSYNLKVLKDILKKLPKIGSTDDRDTLIRPTERD